MRVAFLGNDRWSVPTLRALDGAHDVEVVLVLTNTPRPAGRGSRLRRTDVAVAAEELGLPLLEAEGVRHGPAPAAIDDASPDGLVVVAYGELLPPEVLDVPSLGTVNLHFSLLPRWRGAAPVQRAILEGDDVTGVTVMLVDEGLDTGPVLARMETPIGSDEDVGALGDRLAELGAPVLVDVLRSLLEGSAEPRSQGHGATYAAKIAPEERVIDWSHPAASIARRVRAFAPSPGAHTTFRDAPLKVLRVEARIANGWTFTKPSPGRIAVTPDGAPVVTTSDGHVALLEVAPAGRSRMTGADWARGARFGPEEHVG